MEFVKLQKNISELQDNSFKQSLKITKTIETIQAPKLLGRNSGHSQIFKQIYLLQGNKAELQESTPLDQCEN